MTTGPAGHQVERTEEPSEEFYKVLSRCLEVYIPAEPALRDCLVRMTARGQVVEAIRLTQKELNLVQAEAQDLIDRIGFAAARVAAAINANGSSRSAEVSGPPQP
jgi:hypothetical protein